MLKIKEFRMQKNISQTALADVIGVSLRTLADYERGISDIPLTKLLILAEYFECHLMDLLEIDKKMPMQIVSEPTPLYGKVKHQDQKDHEGKDAIIKMQKELIESYKKQIELLLENLDRVNAQNIG